MAIVEHVNAIAFDTALAEAFDLGQSARTSTSIIDAIASDCANDHVRTEVAATMLTSRVMDATENYVSLRGRDVLNVVRTKWPELEAEFQRGKAAA